MPRLATIPGQGGVRAGSAFDAVLRRRGGRRGIRREDGDDSGVETPGLRREMTLDHWLMLGRKQPSAQSIWQRTRSSAGRVERTGPSSRPSPRPRAMKASRWTLVSTQRHGDLAATVTSAHEGQASNPPVLERMAREPRGLRRLRPAAPSPQRSSKVGDRDKRLMMRRSQADATAQGRPHGTAAVQQFPARSSGPEALRASRSVGAASAEALGDAPPISWPKRNRRTTRLTPPSHRSERLCLPAKNVRRTPCDLHRSADDLASVIERWDKKRPACGVLMIDGNPITGATQPCWGSLLLSTFDQHATNGRFRTCAANERHYDLRKVSRKGFTIGWAIA